MNNKLEEQLKKVGLKDHEAKIYLALLELGQGTVTEISKGAHLNRTTGYDILERLCLYGLAGRSKIGNKRYYVAEPPRRLKQFLEDQKKMIDNKLENLNSFFEDLQSLHKSELKPVIKFAEGQKAMENMYYHVLDSKTDIYSVLNLQNYAEIFGGMGEIQSDERFKKGIDEKIIAIKNPTAQYWWNKLYKGKPERQKNTEYRWLAPEKGKFTAGEVLIFDDKVISLLSNPKENISFEIQSESFANFLKIIFELAWKQMGEKNRAK